MTSGSHLGRCRCGAVRFVAAGAPLRVANCHCGDCRKATGAAFATFVDYKRNKVDFEGAPDAYRSSKGVERLYCRQCGAPIGYRGDASPEELNLYIGAFDAPDAFSSPTDECHQESALWSVT